MEAKSDNTDEGARQGAIGPGERLQAARIRKGLTVDDVAGRMHLSVNILEAIEDNNFDEITAPIFVKGYLRAYARIVALSEDEMIQQYIDFYSEEDPPINSTSNMAPELSVGDARIKWTTYLVIVVLGVLLAAWWWNKQQSEEAPISLDTQSSQVDSSASNDQPVIAGEIQAGSESMGDAAVTSPVAETVEPVEPAESAESAESVESVEVSSAATGMAPTATTEDTVVDADMAPETVATAESGTDAAPSAAVIDEVDTGAGSAVVKPVTGTRESPGRIAPSGSDRLKIVIHADTWADVKDANSFQLVYDLLRADTELELSGEAPFSVFLGNGHGVEILFNDAEVSITSKVRGDNTARIDIGG